MAVDRSKDNGAVGMFGRKSVKKSKGSLGERIINGIGKSLENASTTSSGKNLGKALQGQDTVTKNNTQTPVVKRGPISR